MTCRTCKFCRDRESGIGVCHRFPPDARQGFPMVALSTWCGEYVSRDAVVEPQPLMAAQQMPEPEPVRVDAGRPKKTWRERIGI